MDDFNSFQSSLMRALKKAREYELAEGFIAYTENGVLVHTTPEMLGIDIDVIFVGIEDVVHNILVENVY